MGDSSVRFFLSLAIEQLRIITVRMALINS